MIFFRAGTKCFIEFKWIRRMFLPRFDAVAFCEVEIVHVLRFLSISLSRRENETESVFIFIASLRIMLPAIDFVEFRITTSLLFSSLQRRLPDVVPLAKENGKVYLDELRGRAPNEAIAFDAIQFDSDSTQISRSEFHIFSVILLLSLLYFSLFRRLSSSVCSIILQELLKSRFRKWTNGANSSCIDAAEDEISRHTFAHIWLDGRRNTSTLNLHNFKSLRQLSEPNIR